MVGVDPLISLPVLVVAGFAHGWALFAKVPEAPHIKQILLTFGLALAIQHIAIILWTGNAR